MHGDGLFSDDPFAASRMPFGEHLEELRRHMIHALAGLGIILVLVFAVDAVGYGTGTAIGIARPMKDFITFPVEQELQRFFERRVERVLKTLDTDPLLKRINRPTPFVRVSFARAQLEAALRGLPLEISNPEDTSDLYTLWMRYEEPLREAALRHEAERQIFRRATLATMSIAEGMLVYFKVALACGIILGSPWILWQFWAFVAVGLYPQEKRPVYVYLPFSLGLFLSGICVCQFLVIPRTIEAMLGFNEWLDLEPDLRLSEWLSFAVWMPLIFGLSFQTPLAMLFLAKIGIVSVDTLRRKRRVAWFLLAILAALITPTVDYISMTFLWLPMALLFELGILLCRWLVPVEEDYEIAVMP